MTKKDYKGLKTLYQKSSLTLFIVSGFLFLLIILNLDDLYRMLPVSYRGGLIIVFFVGLTKVYDSLLGNNNAILYNSDHYRSLLFMGAFLAVSVVLFNLWLIPRFGINGAAFGTFLAIALYNTIKLFYVRQKFAIQPFTKQTLQVALLLLVTGIVFYFVNVPIHPIPNILLKCVFMTAFYVGILYRFNLSEDVTGLLSKIFKRK